MVKKLVNLLRKWLYKSLDKNKKEKLNFLKNKLIVENLSFKFFSSLKKDFKLDNKVLVGTHHKTGTAWMEKIFIQISLFHKLRYYNGKISKKMCNSNVIFNDHSNFKFGKIDFPYKGIHLIRDPRDVIVSATFYHQKSLESWLHIPRKKFGGKTYQEKISSFDKIDNKILFEMEHSSKNNIIDMMKWDYNNKNFYEVKYEDLIKDVNLNLFHDIFLFLGFPGKVLPSLLEIAYRNSLFSDRINQSRHVRSGKINQYKKYFKTIHKKRFINLFGDVLTQLGYEKNNSW
ncbi:MAG: sulfotransferase domain-containing protein [Candidatus Mcinerneyibacterium aminivorans]|uniref:Sulfotransferase domain-containing protein n=1 Tax=Candidatus Mcinerneyibacterium aminivorans TaxID=2703815 RepID=A0A5D0MGF4_9BACT|nr:MAG: sulfotransferase domain-containing protein [Candidatus Mcinerneyibacterium aminivorans]